MTATIARPLPDAPPKPKAQYDCVVLDGVNWDTYA